MFLDDDAEHWLLGKHGVDHNMGFKPWASALRLISRNALASGLARLMIDAGSTNERKTAINAYAYAKNTRIRATKLRRI